jgi:magnesium and cobalt transporter
VNLPRSLALALSPADLGGLAVWWLDLGYAAVFFFAETVAVFSTWALTAIENHSRARILDLAAQQGRREWAAQQLQRLPTYDLTVRLSRFAGNAVLVVGAAWLLLRVHGARGVETTDDPAVPWGPLAAVLGIAFGLTFLLNDVLVRLLARRRPNRFLVAAFPWLAGLRRLTTPLRIPTKFLAWIFFRVSLEGSGPGAREEVRLAVEEGRRSGGFTPAEAEMLEAIVDFDRMTVGDVLTARGEMVMLQADAPAAEAAATAHRTGHSRFPVYGKDREDVLGVLTVHDLLGHFARRDGAPPKVRELMRKPFFVPDGKPVRDLLEEMRARHARMAVVLDALGSVRGLVTVEDLLSLIVGGLDGQAAASASAAAPSLRPGTYDFDGRTAVEEVNASLGTSLPVGEEFETIGGLVLHRLGRVPVAGEALSLDAASLTVTEADERTIRKVRVQVAAPAVPATPP